MKIKLLGIDLAKNVFQVCALNQANKVVFNRKVTRDKLPPLIANTPPTIVAMESCSSAHYWGRRFSQQGHHVILIPAQHVKPFVHGGKSDSHDALAICEAAQRGCRKTQLKKPFVPSSNFLISLTKLIPIFLI
ncbi:MAG: transposase [Xanthomonadales bacterium]|nr:transposase [Xanthomonadales bacterium]